MDWFAVVSNGAYPTPATVSTQRAALAVSWGLLSVVFAAVVTASRRSRWVLKYLKLRKRI